MSEHSAMCGKRVVESLPMRPNAIASHNIPNVRSLPHAALEGRLVPPLGDQDALSVPSFPIRLAIVSSRMNQFRQDPAALGETQRNERSRFWRTSRSPAFR